VLMNTMIVLLCDKGVVSSEKALNGLCAIHRLFLACCQRYPMLQNHVNATLLKFLSDEKSRTKEECPNLGQLWMLLSVSSISWKTVAPLIISETFDRNVIWVCKKYPALAENTNPSETPDFDRLSRTFEAANVSLRLTMFNVYFLRKFRGNYKFSEIAESYDLFFWFSVAF